METNNNLLQSNIRHLKKQRKSSCKNETNQKPGTDRIWKSTTNETNQNPGKLEHGGKQQSLAVQCHFKKNREQSSCKSGTKWKSLEHIFSRRIKSELKVGVYGSRSGR